MLLRPLLLSVSLAAVFASAAASAVDVTALHCPRVLDTEGGKMLGESTIVIDGKTIREIKSGHVAVDGAKDVELKDVTCLPGLIDSHTHLTGETSPTGYTDQFRWNIADYAIRSTVYAQRTLQAGFTCVRNLYHVRN